jgi:ABC-2 type transport system ATP-binding protein
MLSSHLLTEVESIVQRVIILRRGHLGLARKLSDLEMDSTIVVEVRGPAEQASNVLRSTEGVAQVTQTGHTDGVVAFEVRTQQFKDLRELISQRLTQQGWPLRRLDLHRRSLQDRWNEINNWEEFGARPDGAGWASSSTAVTSQA